MLFYSHDRYGERKVRLCWMLHSHAGFRSGDQPWYVFSLGRAACAFTENEKPALVSVSPESKEAAELLFTSGDPEIHLHPSLPAIAFHSTAVFSTIHVHARLLTHIQASHHQQCWNQPSAALMTPVCPMKLWNISSSKTRLQLLTKVQHVGFYSHLSWVGPKGLFTKPGFLSDCSHAVGVDTPHPHPQPHPGRHFCAELHSAGSGASGRWEQRCCLSGKL